MPQIKRQQIYIILDLLNKGYSKNKIAVTLNVHKCTIYREIKRNCDQRSGEYKPELAQKNEDRLKSRNHFSKLNEKMQTLITNLLSQKLSPEQITGRCKLFNISIVSHETIY